MADEVRQNTGRKPASRNWQSTDGHAKNGGFDGRGQTVSRFADPSDAPDRTRHDNHQTRVEHNAKDAPDVTTQKPIYRRRWFLIAAVCVLIVAALVGLYFYLHARAHETTDDAFIDSSVVQVSPQAAGTVLKVYVADNQLVKAGDLVAELDARDYKARLGQAAAALQAAEARRDQALANVDLTRTTSYANVAQTAAGVDTARAQKVAAARGAQARQGNIAQTTAGTRTAEANFEQTQADERAAAALAERDERDVVRYQTLYANDAVSRQRLDQAIAAARTSAAQLDAAKKRTQANLAQISQSKAATETAVREYDQSLAQTDAAKSQVDEAQGRLAEANAAPERVRVSNKQADTAEAEIKQARESVAQAELDLSYTKIYAPETGRVTRKSIDEGQLVHVGQPLLAIVYGEMWVTANFKETQLTKMRVGQPVEISVDTYPNRTFKGHVESFQYGTGARFSPLPPQNATGNYVKVVQRIPVKILFDEPPDTHLLAPGMSVVPDIDISAAPDPSAIHRGYGTGGGSMEGTGSGGGGSGSGGASGGGNSGGGSSMDGGGQNGSQSGSQGGQTGQSGSQGGQTGGSGSSSGGSSGSSGGSGGGGSGGK